MTNIYFHIILFVNKLVSYCTVWDSLVIQFVLLGVILSQLSKQYLKARKIWLPKDLANSLCAIKCVTQTKGHYVLITGYGGEKKAC